MKTISPQITKGDIVEIHSATISGKPIIEGRATIVSKAGNTENYWNVRFHGDGHNMTYPRFVMPEHKVREVPIS